MAVAGFEPTPARRLVPKTSALDHSATLPNDLPDPGKHAVRLLGTGSSYSGLQCAYFGIRSTVVYFLFR